MARISSFSFRLIARASRFCVFWIRKTMRKVMRAVPVPMTCAHLFEKCNIGPVAAHTAITRPAPTNAQVDPSQPEATAANRPKWSCTVGVCTSVARLIIRMASVAWLHHVRYACVAEPVCRIGSIGGIQRQRRLRYTASFGGFTSFRVRRLFPGNLISVLPSPPIVRHSLPHGRRIRAIAEGQHTPAHGTAANEAAGKPALDSP